MKEQRRPIVGFHDVKLSALYKNTKTNGIYRLLDTGVHTETGEPMAYYKEVKLDPQTNSYEVCSDAYFRPLRLFAGLRSDNRPYFELLDGED